MRTSRRGGDPSGPPRGASINRCSPRGGNNPRSPPSDLRFPQGSTQGRQRGTVVPPGDLQGDTVPTGAIPGAAPPPGALARAVAPPEALPGAAASPRALPGVTGSPGILPRAPGPLQGAVRPPVALPEAATSQGAIPVTAGPPGAFTRPAALPKILTDVATLTRTLPRSAQGPSHGRRQTQGVLPRAPMGPPRGGEVPKGPPRGGRDPPMVPLRRQHPFWGADAQKGPPSCTPRGSPRGVCTPRGGGTPRVPIRSRSALRALPEAAAPQGSSQWWWRPIPGAL
ncbi:basic salivary proline-rich protein 1-like [Homarus americanus]|nr:basic salivary proline-rich protein 1-like [Homarus americanus]XP_042221238.1 basic salivary proline-rich protein 1-like [Homarus americanus]